jgi:hypothetical protein
VSAITGEAPGDSEPITTQISTSHRPRISIRRAPERRTNRSLGLSGILSMPSGNGIAI